LFELSQYRQVRKVRSPTGLLYLFLFSILLYPLLRWLKGNGHGFLSRLDGWLSKSVAVYILALPILLLYLLPSDVPLMDENGGWLGIVYSQIVNPDVISPPLLLAGAMRT